jgi:hypothetical protein
VTLVRDRVNMQQTSPLERCLELEMAVSEWLQMHKTNFYYDRIFKCVLRWDKCINVVRDHVGIY